jgi:hypothetical protein
MSMSFQLEKLKNVIMDFINSQQYEEHNVENARPKRKSLGAKGKRAQALRDCRVLTLNPNIKGKVL